MIRLLISLLFIGLVSFSYGQSYIKDAGNKERKWFKESGAKAVSKDYKSAFKLLDKVLNKYPDNIDVILRKGAFYLQQDNYPEAEIFFNQAISLNPDYDSRVYFSYGIVLYKQEKFEKAFYSFDTFLKSQKGRKKQKARAKKYRVICEFAMEAIKNPVPFSPTRLPEGINNTNLQYLPTLTADGESLLYTERSGGFEELYISHKKDGIFNKGVPFADVNLPQGEAAHCISPDGKTIIVTSNDRNLGFGSCDLFFSTYRDEKWSPPSNMGPIINSTTWDSQPSLSADGKTLYFSSKRRLGVGESDLYSATKNKDGKWQVPVNLGNVINTTGSDESPFIHPDNNTLYFRSNGHPGMGSFDIFVSKRNHETGEWQAPINLGYPINTQADDGALFVSLDGTTAYYTSDRYSKENNLPPNLDLYSFPLHKEARPTPVSYVKGNIIDALTKKPLSAEITITSSSNTTAVSTDATGQFLVTLPSYEDYSFAVKKSGYIFHSKRFELKSVSTAMEPVVVTIELFPVPKKEDTKDIVVYDQPIILENILFKSGSAKLLETSFSEIDNLFQIMSTHPHVKIKIIGHTDNIGNPSDNKILSEQRAQSVMDALISKGISKSRLTSDGKGEEEPIKSNDSEEGRKANRRTTFILVKN